MKKTIIVLALCASMAALAAWSSRSVSAAGNVNQPSYTADGKLTVPANYREWVFLTSGFGMNYSNGAGANPMFTNVYVSPEAYQGFKSSGKWPDKSMFIVEIYSPATHGSINKSGHYQNEFHGLDVEVKDSSRSNEWSYYNFNPGETTAEALPGGCNKCHSENGAVEHTFVQFYPTLLDFSIEKNLIKPGVHIPLNGSRFAHLVETAGFTQAEQAYAEDRKTNPSSDLLNENSLNLVGYSLLSKKKTEDAISVFKLVTRDYPNSANAYDSLGDAYAAASRPELAIAASQKEISLAQADTKLSPQQKQQLTDLAQKRISQMKQN